MKEDATMIRKKLTDVKMLTFVENARIRFQTNTTKLNNVSCTAFKTQRKMHPIQPFTTNRNIYTLLDLSNE